MSETAPTAVRPEQLRLRCDPSTLDFETTAELPPLVGLAGQPRAAEALAFGIGTAQSGFNVFVAGEPGTGKSTAVRALLAEVARGRPTPGDWCYVHNFQDASRPRALRLAPGEGSRLVAALHDLVDDARREIPRVFESEEYIAAREAGMNALNRRRQELFARIGGRGEELGFAIQFTSSGVAAVPILNGRPAGDEDIASLTEEARAAIRSRREELAKRPVSHRTRRMGENETAAMMHGDYLNAALAVLRASGCPMDGREITDAAIAAGLIAPIGKTPAQSMRARLYVALRDRPEVPLERLFAPGRGRARRGSVRWRLRA